jgi:hypothetical protein
LKNLLQETTDSKAVPCPCEDCVCLAICRLKGYHPLVQNCQILKTHLYRRQVIDTNYRTGDFPAKIIKVRDVLKPMHWEVREGGPVVQIHGINLKELQNES